MIFRKKAQDGTASGGDVLLEGNASERLPSDKVYVDPTNGRVYDEGKGDKLAQLPPDAVEIPKSTWGGYDDDAPDFLSNDYWYTSYEGTRRLNLEKLQMLKNRSPFMLCKRSDGTLFWTGQLRVSGHLHRQVILQYSGDHPYDDMPVYIKNPQLPVVNHHIFSDGKICYQNGDWSTDWTAWTVLCTVIRFLHEFYSGRMSKGSSLQQLQLPNLSIDLSKINYQLGRYGFP